MRNPVVPALILIAILLCSCPAGQETAGDHTAAAAAGEPAEVEISGPGVPEAPEPWDPEVPGTGITGQFIIIYSGDTLSIPLPHQDFEPPQGGLSALAGGVADYAGQIVDYNRMRIINEGGDASGIRADFDGGFLGEHPFILLDYGGWERPNDPLGGIYVSRYFAMFSALKYDAVGCPLYGTLPAERWAGYPGTAGETPPLLASSGTPRGETPPVAGCIEREVRGETWKVLSLSLASDDDGERFANMLADWDGLATGHGLDSTPSILLASGAPPQLYVELQADPRATVVIGANPGKAVHEGYGEITRGVPLLLPSVDPGGRSIGVCHLYYFDDGDNLPDMYFLTKWLCIDEAERPLPFRKQVREAVDAHRTAYAESVGDGR